jgi:hypothetical protein
MFTTASGSPMMIHGTISPRTQPIGSSVSGTYMCGSKIPIGIGAPIDGAKSRIAAIAST